MDIDGPSSPLAPPSSLPPSAEPLPTASSNGRTPQRANGHVNVNGNANGADALAIDDIAQDANMEGGEEEIAARRRRARTHGRIDGDVPLVRDALGEQITESFETFLET